jgi:hypothetical protein
MTGNYTVGVTSSGCSSTSPITSVTFLNQNYVTQRTILVDKKQDGTPVSEADIQNLTIGQKTETTKYLDGLGRTMQTVATQASPSMQDIVTPVVYDAYGRQYRSFLPFTNGSNGLMKTSILDANNNYSGVAVSFYTNTPNVAADSQPFAQSVFEPSPLNRVVEQGAPGVTYQPGTGHAIKKSYQNNQTGEVLLFTHDPATGLILLAPGRYYNPGTLYANRTTDEHGNDAIEYVDWESRTVCKKVQYKTDTDGVTKKYASTYYIFDDMGNLVVVLPPDGVKIIAPTEN